MGDDSSKLIFGFIVYYVVLIGLLGLFSISNPDVTPITVPSWPDIPVSIDIPIAAELLAILLFFIEFIGFILLVLGFFFNVMKFSLVGLLPSWMNIMIFAPPVAYLGYEIAKYIRGSS